MLVVAILIIILLLLAVVGVIVYFWIEEDDFSVNDSSSYLDVIEEAYERVILEGRIELIYPYATIPLALNVANRLRYDCNYRKGHSYKNAEVWFEFVPEESTEDTDAYIRHVEFKKVFNENFHYGDDHSEYWFINKITNKLQRIAAVVEAE